MCRSPHEISGLTYFTACENCHKYSENCLVAKKQPLPGLPMVQGEEDLLPLHYQARPECWKNPTAGSLRCLEHHLEGPVAAKDGFILPDSHRMRIDDLRMDVSVLMDRVRQLEMAKELSRELLILTSQVLLNINPNHQAAHQYLLNTEGLRGEEPVASGSRTDGKKRRRVVAMVEIKWPRNHPTPPSKHLDSVLMPESEEDAV